MTDLHFTIQGRPTAWKRAVEYVDPRSGKRRKITDRDMKVAQASIKGWATTALAGRPPLQGALKLEVLCVYAIPPSWDAAKQAAARAGLVWKTSVADLDNLFKQIGDALNGVAYVDDAQIVRLSAGKRYGSPARTEVRLSVMPGFNDHSTTPALRAWAREQDGQASFIGSEIA